jgi:F-type H+-transporting ATPase subunit delta
MVVAANRGSELSSILDAAVEKGAQSRGQSVAEVRSAVPLTEEQIQRLTAALNKATGKNLTIKTVVDESVIGGIVTTIDDEVIDGSVRHRVTKLREAF